MFSESIVAPDEPLSLRLSGQLLLGVVRVFEKKCDYLRKDMSAARVSIYQAFNSKKGNVNLKASDQVAHNINLKPTVEFTLIDEHNDLGDLFQPDNKNDAPIHNSYATHVGDSGSERYVNMKECFFYIFGIDTMNDAVAKDCLKIAADANPLL
jgi:hypothetical protein